MTYKSEETKLKNHPNSLQKRHHACSWYENQSEDIKPTYYGNFDQVIFAHNVQ